MATNILCIKDISKNFGNVEVLKKFNMSVEQGEVHALLGANGAGKSTLIKIIGGIIQKTSGNILFKDKEYIPSSPIEAQKNGISIIHQELSIIPTLNVLDNFFLGREITKNGFIDKKEMIKEYKKICEEMNFDIPWNIKAKELSVAKHQMIEIMKAISFNSDLIVMDEPTTSLTNYEKENLFKIVESLKSRGKTIIYISHMLDEIFQICNSATIMLAGINNGSFKIEELTKTKIAQLMSGKTVNISKKKDLIIDYNTSPILKVENISSKGKFENVNFSIYRKEVLGIAGLVGAGRTELARALFGLDNNLKGKIILNDKEINIKSPKQAISLGIGLIPEDRKMQGLILKHEIYKNSTILSLDKMKKNLLINKQLEYSYTQNAVEKLKVKLHSPSQKIQDLSGGNQQKIVVSKWIEKELNLIIFDEPTKGIDINAKEDIFLTIENFSKSGAAVIFISSDLEEVLRVSDRILVMHNGKIVKDRKNIDLTVTDLMKDILINK